MEMLRLPAQLVPLELAVTKVVKVLKVLKGLKEVP